MNVPETLETPVDRDMVRRLYATGLLTPEARDAALAWLRPRRRWAHWSQRMLLAAGSALMLAGAIYFFAFNWDHVPHLVKLALPQAGIVACVALAVARGLDRIVGQAALIGATFLTGAALAVYGQVYQTGADAYELFVGWAALTVGWVIIARSGLLWIFWLIIVNIAVILWWDQVVDPSTDLEFTSLFVLLALIDGAALAAAETAHARHIAWLRRRFYARLLLAASLFWLTLPTITLVLEPKYVDVAGVIAPVLLAGAYAGCFILHRKFRRDIAALTLASLSACSIVVTLVGKMTLDVLDGGACGLLVTGLATVLVFAGAVLWLAREHRSTREAIRG